MRWTKQHDDEYDRIMTPRWEQIAKDNLEKHIGDVVHEEMTAEEVFEEAFTLALDALHDKTDCPASLAAEIANRVAHPYGGERGESRQ